MTELKKLRNIRDSLRQGASLSPATIEAAASLAVVMPVIVPWEHSKSYTGPTEIPFQLLDRDHAMRVHAQTLERLAERGGMSPSELVGNILRLRWNEFPEFAAAVEILKTQTGGK